MSLSAYLHPQCYTVMTVTHEAKNTSDNLPCWCIVLKKQNTTWCDNRIRHEISALLGNCSKLSNCRTMTESQCVERRQLAMLSRWRLSTSVMGRLLKQQHSTALYYHSITVVTAVHEWVKHVRYAGFCNTELRNFVSLCAKADKDLLRKSRIIQCNFMIRMLYCHMHWLLCHFLFHFIVFYLYLLFRCILSFLY